MAPRAAAVTLGQMEEKTVLQTCLMCRLCWESRDSKMSTITSTHSGSASSCSAAGQNRDKFFLKIAFQENISLFGFPLRKVTLSICHFLKTFLLLLLLGFLLLSFVHAALQVLQDIQQLFRGLPEQTKPFQRWILFWSFSCVVAHFKRRSFHPHLKEVHADQ